MTLDASRPKRLAGRGPLKGLATVFKVKCALGGFYKAFEEANGLLQIFALDQVRCRCTSVHWLGAVDGVTAAADEFIRCLLGSRWFVVHPLPACAHINL